MLPTFFRSSTFRAATLMGMVLIAGACSDQPITSTAAPTPPTPVSSQAGLLRGTVREDGTVYFESLDPSIRIGGGPVSEAIYGNQNVTAKVTTSNFSVTTTGATKTWKFTLAVHNLLPYPVGVIDGVSSTPFDTVGMFVFFPSAPTVTAPTNCGCSVTILNTQGTGAFTAPNQQYYWYRDRLAASGLAGDSTTHNPTWTFSTPAAVTNFRFFVILSSPWPRGMQTQDTTWSVMYSPVSDSLPDVNASPAWKRTGVGFGGTYTSSSTALTMDVTHAKKGQSDDFIFYRSDNLNRSENAYIESQLSLTGSGGNPQVILALADSVRFVGLGIGAGNIGIVTYNTNNNRWQWTIAKVPETTTGTHVYRIGKFGATLATVYMDGAEIFTVTDALIPNNFMPNFVPTGTPTQVAHTSALFGVTGQDQDAHVVMNYVTYAFHATPKP